MANSLATATFIVKESLRVLHTRCKVLQMVNKEWNKLFGRTIGPLKKAGTTVYVPKPILGNVRTGWNMDASDVTENTMPITIDTVRGIDLYFTESDLSLSLADFSDKIIVPNVMKLAANIDAYCASYMKDRIYNVVPVTTIGTAPNDVAYFLKAAQLIKEGLAPEDSSLNCLISPRTEAAMVKALAGQYNPGGNISEMFLKGQMSRAAGLDWYMTQNMPAHTHGTNATTNGTISGYDKNTLTISGVTAAGTLRPGDSLTMVTCFPVNFETKAAYSEGQRCVVTGLATATGSGNTIITVTVKPDLVISGADQTIDRTPVGSTVSFHQSTASQVVQNDFVLHKEAFAMAFADLYEPKGMEMAKSYSQDGVSVRFVKGFDINTSQQVSRLDCFFGIAPMRTEWAARIIS
jgi:hypothetical protein